MPGAAGAVNVNGYSATSPGATTDCACATRFVPVRTLGRSCGGSGPNVPSREFAFDQLSQPVLSQRPDVGCDSPAPSATHSLPPTYCAEYRGRFAETGAVPRAG